MGSRKKNYKKETTLILYGTSRMGMLFSRTVFYKQRWDVGMSIRNTDVRFLIYRRLESDVTKTEVKEFILEMKNNKATGYEGIPAEFPKIFCIRRDGIQIVTNMFNIFKKMGKNFQWTGRLLLYTKLIKGRETERNRETAEVFRFHRYVAEYTQESWLVDCETG
jgi:hypothetical protein